MSKLDKLMKASREIALESMGRHPSVSAEGLSRAETVQAVRRASGRLAEGKGRGVRKPTTHMFRRVAGCTVTVENGRGLDPASTRAALVEAIARLDAEAEVEPGEQAA